MMSTVARLLREVCLCPPRVSSRCVCVCSPSCCDTRHKAGFSTVRSGFVGKYLEGESSWMSCSSAAVLSAVRSNVQVLQNFISKEEETAFLKELDPGLKRKKYEFDHWDDAIHGFRETERLQWGGACAGVLERLRVAAFPEGSRLLGPVHVLDLDKAGFIKAHVDSVKFCGSTIAGLSLLSDSVMRLVHEDNTADHVHLLLNRCSLYILRNDARFKFTHEILKDEESYFSGRKIPRHRRISVICRNLPL